MEPFCIIVPSHITYVSRLKNLYDCLQSLQNQTRVIPIYLSISFETPFLQSLFEVQKDRYEHPCIHIRQCSKKSQFRHIAETYELYANKYEFLMFCDDDDIYDATRVQVFQTCVKQNACVDGLYESISNVDIPEYWAYCIHSYIFELFLTAIRIDYDYILDHVFCDVLFSSYLSSFLFFHIQAQLYTYIEHDTSVTGQILANNARQKKGAKEKEKVFDIHTYVRENRENIKRNIFLIYTIYRYDFDRILHRERLFAYKDILDPDIMHVFQNEYNRIHYICDAICISLQRQWRV